MHDHGGGLERWVVDYCRADKERTNLVLRSKKRHRKGGTRLELYNNINDTNPVRVWNFFTPVLPTSITHAEYRRALSEIFGAFSIDCIYISSLIGHSLDILDTGIKTIKICHDYHPFCPNINIYTDGVCTECGTEDLLKCLKRKGLLGLSGRRALKRMLDFRNRFLKIILEQHITLVVPTDSIRRNLIRLEPAFSDADFVEIPHGLDTGNYPDMPEAEPVRKPGRPRIIITGMLIPKKGLQLFRDSYRDILKRADIYLVGCGDNGKSFEREDGVHVISRYNQRELPGIISGISPDLGLLMSVVPETFSYTLSELMYLGVPTMATRIGAFSDRIEDGVNGFLFSPDKSGLLEKMDELLAHPEVLARVKDTLRETHAVTTADMVRDYHRLVPLDANRSHSAANIKEVSRLDMARHYFIGIFRLDTLDYYLLKKTRINMIEVEFRKRFLNPLKNTVSDKLKIRKNY